MASVRGTIEKIHVGEVLAGLTISPNDGGASETLLIWSEIGQTYSPREKLLHGTWLSLLREALSDGREVRCTHPDGNALITSVTAYG